MASDEPRPGAPRLSSREREALAYLEQRCDEWVITSHFGWRLGVPDADAGRVLARLHRLGLVAKERRDGLAHWSLPGTASVRRRHLEVVRGRS